jgi:hypothetical protein
MDAEQVKLEPTVRRWASSARFDDDPRELNARAELLLAFCEFANTAPAAIIEGCLLADADAAVGGQREISIRGRREMNDQIEAWSDQLVGTEFMRITAGNTIRGFLVHNGILIQGHPAL